MRSLSRSVATLLMAAAALLAAGCAEDVPAASPGDAAFTLWGQLNPAASQQAVLVAPITATANEAVTLDGTTVESEDLRSGVVTPWRDSLVTYADGSSAHVFVADLQPAYGNPVEFRVRRDGAVVTSARVDVPPRVTAFLEDPVIAARSSLGLLLPGAPRVVGAQMVYTAEGAGREFVDAIPLTPADIRSVEHGWRLTVTFATHAAILDDRFIQRDVEQYDVTGVRFRGAVASRDWAAPYPFSFSRDLLVQPGTVSNVRGGYGFVGAAYTFDVAWDADTNLIRRVGL